MKNIQEFIKGGAYIACLLSMATLINFNFNFFLRLIFSYHVIYFPVEHKTGRNGEPM